MRHNAFHQTLRSDATRFPGDHDEKECSRRCAVGGCDDMKRDHARGMCIACFERYATDDSLVDGGVYHLFKEEET